MRIAINTPNGNIGRALCEHLLDAKAELVLLTRSPDKTKALEKRSAKVRVGNLDDRDFVKKATKDVDALFWLTPGDSTSADFRGVQNTQGGNAAAAVTANNIVRVVNLSSVGAQESKGNGPIGGLHDVEKMLDETGASVTHLRPNYFMENYFLSTDGIKSAGSIFLPVRGDVTVPMIATADIARAAAERLLDDQWSGRNVIELAGPEDVSFDEAAKTLGKVTGKTIQHVEVTPEQAKEAMTGVGVHASTADVFLEMYDAFNKNAVAHETTPKRTKTTLAQFFETALKPAL